MRWMASVVSLCLLASVSRAADPDITGEARKLLDQAAGAYGKLTTLRVEGTMVSAFDIGGQQPTHEAKIAGEADAKGRFYTAIVGESHMMGNGKKTYMYDFRRNNFVELDPVTERVAMGKLPGQLPALVRDENPSVLMTIVTDPASVLTTGCTKVQRIDDTNVDNVAYPTLALVAPKRQMRVMLDPKTSLIRRVELDYAETYKSAGVPDVKSAKVVLDYTKVEVDGKLNEETLAWTPPRGAYPMKSSGEAMEDDGGASAEGPEKLKGQDAPVLELKDLNGADVKLSELKGKVVVLDFWATWCGPCVQLMPHVVEMNAKYKDKDVAIYGVNCGETPEKIKAFLEKKGFDLNILLDSDNATQKRFGISGIPTTIVVGKDGKVRFVSVGAGPDTGSRIEEALQKALDEK